VTLAAGAREPLWVVEKSGTRVYLIGSLHVLPRSVSPARPALIRAFNDSSRVFFEIATGGDASPEIDGFFRRQGTYRNSDKLQSHLTPDARDLVDLVLPLFKLSWQDVQDHKPWLLGLRLQQSLMRSPGFAASEGVDDYFESLARKKRKPIVGLESASEHIGFFSAMSDAEQSAALIEDIEGLVWLRQDLEMMGKMWQLGATDVFERGLAGHQKTAQGRRLFRDRNLRWVPQIVHLAEGKENALVIVGLGHLVGDDGLVSLLRARGYSVRQM
jgi:uncharacterized protein YbaP (TraB family)